MNLGGQEKRSARWAEGTIVAFVVGPPWPKSAGKALALELLAPAPSKGERGGGERVVFDVHLRKAKDTLTGFLTDHITHAPA